MEGYQNALDELVQQADELAREFGPPAAIVGLYEHTVYAAAVLRGHFHLPGTSASTAVLFRDKVAMKQALLGSGVRLPRFWAVGPQTTAGTLREIAAALPGKAVLKPKGQAGSVGIQIFASSAADELPLAATTTPTIGIATPSPTVRYRSAQEVDCSHRCSHWDKEKGPCLRCRRSETCLKVSEGGLGL